jgi:hypothetical protein
MRVNNAVWTIVFAIGFGLTGFAQTPAPGDSHQGTDPAAQSQTSSQSPDMSSAKAKSANQTQGEKKLKGCIESEGGQFLLRDKHGKEVALTGSQDFASHVGHTVSLQGTYTGTAGATSAGSTGSAEQFMVSKIDMVSATCKEKSEKGKEPNSGKPSPYRP